MTLPSVNGVFRKGSVVINPAAAFKEDGAIEIGCGNPNRAVPRVTRTERSTRSSTGTRIGDGGRWRRARGGLAWRDDMSAREPASDRGNRHERQDSEQGDNPFLTHDDRPPFRCAGATAGLSSSVCRRRLRRRRACPPTQFDDGVASYRFEFPNNPSNSYMSPYFTSRAYISFSICSSTGSKSSSCKSKLTTATLRS